MKDIKYQPDSMEAKISWIPLLTIDRVVATGQGHHGWSRISHTGQGIGNLERFLSASEVNVQVQYLSFIKSTALVLSSVARSIARLGERRSRFPSRWGQFRLYILLYRDTEWISEKMINITEVWLPTIWLAIKSDALPSVRVPTFEYQHGLLISSNSWSR